MSRRITLTDIAEQAEVSTATVSRVLNGKENVAEITKHQVLAALDVLGYERPESMRGVSEGLIGLVVPELTNPIFPLYAQEISQRLVPHGLTPVLCTQTPGGVSEDEYVQMLVDRGVAGIIFVSGRHSDTTSDVTRYEKLRSRNIPLVTINGNAPTIKAPGFTTDDYMAAQIAVEHLLELGHQHIGLVTGPTRMVPAQRKLSGFSATVRAANATEALHIAEVFYTRDGGMQAARQLVEQGCTAAVCGSDLMALGVIQGLRDLGLSVPGDFSVIGYDDSGLNELTSPPLTSVRQPVEAICTSAVRTLVSAIQGDTPPGAEMFFTPSLIVRGSTGPVPAK